MNLSRLVVLPFLLFWLGATFDLPAESSENLRKQFATTKARAERGDAQAQLSLASFYSEGIGVAKDPGKAVKWLRKAAEQGVPRAEFLLSLDYANGRGVKIDQAQAVHWLEQAAEHNLVEAQLELGVWYFKGENVGENPLEAVNWFRRAAEQNLAGAQYQLGQCYLQGAGVPKDIPAGLDWTCKAADQGFAPAQNSLGLCYLNGEGVRKDYVQAYKWFNLAAGQGDPQTYDFKVNLAKAESFLTPEQVALAQKLAREFKPTTTLQNLGSPRPSSTEPGTIASGSAETSASSKVGWLNVKAADNFAEIFVDGSFVGNAPAKLKLEPGTHLVVVKKSGFKDYQRQINISAGSELTLNASLEPN